MRLFRKECKRLCFQVVYLVFLAALVFSWYRNFAGVTSEEIKAAEGGASQGAALIDPPLLRRPEQGQDNYGVKIQENPKQMMTGAADRLLMEYQRNSYATYPFGYYKEVSLNKKDQVHVIQILCEITGLTKEELNHLPESFFPAVNGNIIHFNADMKSTEGEILIKPSGNEVTENPSMDKTKKFISQVTYDRFKEMMKEMEDILGDGSNYAMENLIQYYGQTNMTYEEALVEYQNTIEKDKITGGFARLFCDYLSRPLGLLAVFLGIACWLGDRRYHACEMIYSRPFSDFKLVFSRLMAAVLVALLPVLFLSTESLIPLIRFSVEKGLEIDVFAYLKYIVWWLLPTVMISISLGSFFSLLTNTPIAILLQAAWWFIDSAVTRLYGDVNLLTLMIRHNSLRGSEVIGKSTGDININRFLLVIVSMGLVMVSALLLSWKRRGKISEVYPKQKLQQIFKTKFSTGA